MSVMGEKPLIQCPYCHVLSQMDVANFHFPQDVSSSHGIPSIVDKMEIRRCSNCGGKFFYINGELKYPEPETIIPEKDMPDDVKALFEEAACICNRSPRAACALLRLAVERLCDVLTAKGNTIDEKISDLVSKGLSKDVQKALDVVRVVGNKAVHPGQIAFDVDDSSTAQMLFRLLNISVRRLITEPSTIDHLYEQLPQSVRAQVLKRDIK